MGRWPWASVALALAVLGAAASCGDGDEDATDARASADTAVGADRAGDAPASSGGALDGGGGAPDTSAGAGMCESCTATCTADSMCDAPGRCAKFGNGCTGCLFCKGAEVCGNDVDDNCNGTIDEDCAPCQGKSSCGANQACVPPQP